jgi:hypothetical protein
LHYQVIHETIEVTPENLSLKETAMEFTDKQFGRAVDRAVAEENAAYLNDPDLQAQDARDAARWMRWMAAEKAAGPTAVVLPVALAQDILRALQGEPTHLPVDPSVIVAMLQGHLDKAEVRR